MAKKRLVYFMFVDSSVKSSIIYDVHFYNLKKFRHCFDCCTFWISVKDFSDENRAFANEIIERLINIGYFENTEFKIHKNDELREAICFKEEVVKRIEDEANEWVFFGHSKGITNEINESLLLWICSMYYFGLNFENELNKTFKDAYNYKAFYGFPLKYSPGYLKHQHHYAGTFYWTKILQAGKIIKMNEIAVEDIKDRFYAENFTGEYFEMFYTEIHERQALIDKNYYYCFDESLNEYFERNDILKSEKDGFFEYYNDLKKTLFNDKI